MAVAANAVSQVKKNTSMLCFGVRAMIDNSLEHVVLAFDYETFVVNQYVDGNLIVSISFAEFKQVQTTGQTVSILFTRGNPTVFTALSDEDASNIYQFVDNIIDNIQEILSNDSTLVTNLCESFKSKICLRKCSVTEKKFKRFKGKSKGVSGFLKKPKKKGKEEAPAAGQRASGKVTGGGGSVGFIVMTELHLLLFKDATCQIPLYMFPLASVEFEEKTDDTCFTFKCMGTKATFALSDIEQKLLWVDACSRSKSVSDHEVLDLEEKTTEAWRLLSVDFDKENEEHVAMLRRLWDASQLEMENGEKKHEFCVKGNRWKDLGFQRDDPTSDFRATGMLGLENLVYFAENYPELFLGMNSNQQQASEMEYPFATAGINMTYLLMGLLHLERDRQWYPNLDMHPLFFWDANAWQELYVIVFRLFDQKWNQMLVGYMGYQEVVEATRESAHELLAKRSVMGCPAIFDMLGILRTDLPNFKTDTQQKTSKAEFSFQGETDAAAAAPAAKEAEVTTDTVSDEEVKAAVISLSEAALATAVTVPAVSAGSSGERAKTMSSGSATPPSSARGGPASSRGISSSGQLATPVDKLKPPTPAVTPSKTHTAPERAKSIEATLTASTPNVGSLAPEPSIPKSMSDVAISGEAEEMAPKPRKRRNTRSKTAVELEEKEASKEASKESGRTRRRSRSRGSLAEKKDKEKVVKKERREEKSSDSGREGRDRKERSERSERSERRKERKEDEKESKSKEREEKRHKKRTSSGSSTSGSTSTSSVIEREKKKDKTVVTSSSSSGDFEKWKETQGKEFIEQLSYTGNGGEEEKKLSATRKLRNSFSLKRNSGVVKKK